MPSRLLQNKDLSGALGALGGTGILVFWSEDIRVLFEFFYQHLGLIDKPLNSATDISTDLTIIVGSAIASYVISKLTGRNKKKNYLPPAPDTPPDEMPDDEVIAHTSIK